MTPSSSLGCPPWCPTRICTSFSANSERSQTSICSDAGKPVRVKFRGARAAVKLVSGGGLRLVQPAQLDFPKQRLQNGTVLCRIPFPAPPDAFLTNAMQCTCRTPTRALLPCCSSAAAAPTCQATCYMQLESPRLDHLDGKTTKRIPPHPAFALCSLPQPKPARAVEL